MAPTPPRPRIAPDPDPDSGDVTSSAEDRLYALLHDGQVRQERLLEALRGDIQGLTAACGQMASKIEALQVTPSLIRMGMAAMVLVVILVGIASGAQVAVSAGWLRAETSPGGE
jgi:hypothetical protein